MSTDKKESIGFRTSAKTIEEQYAEIFSEINIREMTWQQVNALSQKQAAVNADWLGQCAKKNDKVEAALAMAACAGWTNSTLISKLGVELNQIAKRLTRLEKKLAPKVN